MAAEDVRRLDPTNRIVVVGAGYVGLPAAILLARAGHTVVAVDVEPRVVDAINRGVVHVDEPDLQRVLDEPACRARLQASRTMVPADVFMIAVPTPVDHRRKIADLAAVDAAVESIVPALRPGNLVILESTVPPLTCRERIGPRLRRAGFEPGRDVHLAHCPERILPGNVLHEIVHNDRIIGGVTPASAAAAAAVYRSFVEGELLLTDDVTAELCKLMENAYRDVNVAFANEMAAVADGLGVDVRRAIAFANRHPRVDILSPGIGVGGHCIPVDPWFLREIDDANTRMIAAARAVNDGMPGRIAGRIRRALRDVAEPRIVAIGATYKPDTADRRESPAIEIVELLRADGFDVAHHDPLVDGMGYASLRAAVDGTDALVILVPHTQVRRELERDGDAIRGAMRTPIVLEF
jgi:UDP-N-acetyl-D-mannosaminuronic acid dehydrogenase